jgi:phospholipase C
MAKTSLDKFDHLIVLMLENRSFDNLLGYLYETDRPRHFIGRGDPEFRGVAGKELWNEDDNGNKVYVRKAQWQTPEDMCKPCPDPGEFFQPHVNMQIYGSDIVSNDISQLPDPAPMNGFVRDYIRAIRSPEDFSDAVVEMKDYDIIMHGFTPEAVPVINGLAKEFAVSDEWFASVPTQTFPNRCFLHSGHSHGYVDNGDYLRWLMHEEEPTLFDRLSDRFAPGADFRVYWDEQDIVPMIRAINPSLDRLKYDDRFRHFSEFASDCLKGDLPAYTFIQPRMIVNHNDMHPPAALPLFVHSSVLAGELLINDVYNAVRKGSRWDRTLLVILFDEHGGCYDHWPPPLNAMPPFENPPFELEKGFRFDRFGVRVPAVFISPYIAPGTIIRASGDVPFDHTSVIKTVCQKWDLPGLTQRDQAAPGFADVLSLDQPRATSPEFTPRTYTPIESELARDGLISGLARHILGLLGAKLGIDTGAIREVREAQALLQQLHAARAKRAAHSS